MTLENAVTFALLAYVLTTGISFGVALLIKGMNLAIRLSHTRRATTAHGSLHHPPTVGPDAESVAAES